MKNTLYASTTLILLMLLMLVGCGRLPVAAPTPYPITTTSGSVVKIDTSPVAKSELVPKDVAKLAFNISGQVKSSNIEIGDEVHGGDVLVQLDTTALDADVTRAENALKVAQEQLNLQITQETGKKTEAGLENIATANIAIAEADLVKARYLQSQATMVAPFDGTIVDVQVVPGEIVAPGKEIITMANMQTMQVETLDLTEMDISRIFINQPVEVYVEALDITLDGYVSTIVPQATLVGQDKVYTVIVRFKSQPQDLRWGMSADAKFIVDE